MDSENALREKMNPSGGQKKVRSTQYQLTVLVEQLEVNRALACGIFTGPMGHQSHEAQWEQVARKVSEHGPEKNAKQCKISWRDLKRKVKTKNASINEARQRTGNNINVPQLTDLELKVLAIIGPQSSIGDGEQESGLDVEENPHVMEPARAKVPDVLEVFEVNPHVAKLTDPLAGVDILHVENIVSQVVSPQLFSLEMEEDKIEETPIRRATKRKQPEMPTTATKAKLNFGDSGDIAVHFAKLQQDNHSVFSEISSSLQRIASTQNESLLSGIASSLQRIATAQEEHNAIDIRIAAAHEERNKIEAQKIKIKMYQIKMLMSNSKDGPEIEDIEQLE